MEKSQKMQVVLIAAPHEGAGVRIAPLGAMAVAAYTERELKDEVAVTVLDTHDETNLDELVEKLIVADARVIGFQIFSSQVATVLDWAKYIKRKIPRAVLVAGGHHPTLTWKTFVERHCGVFDFVIRGDGEIPFTEIVKRIKYEEDASDPPIPGVASIKQKQSSNLIIDQPPIEMSDCANMLMATLAGSQNSLIFSDLVSKRNRKAIAVTTSRSCPLQCSFCSIITMPGKWRAIDSDIMLGWLVESYKKAPFEHVYFMDANFFVVPRRIRELAAGIKELLPGVTWSASSTVKMFLRAKKDLPLLVESGLRMVELGIESGSVRQLKILNKGVTVEENLEAVMLLKKYKLQIGLDFIMFFPDQRVQDIKDNLSFLESADLILERSWNHFINTLELYPGTPLRSTYADRFKINFDDDELPDPYSLFVEADVKNIYYQFVKRFVPEWCDQIDDTYSRLLGVAERINQTDPFQSSKFRLEAVRLRRVVYNVLLDLTNSPLLSYENASPWIKGMKPHVERLNISLNYFEASLEKAS